MEKTDIKLSVLDVEAKYKVATGETVSNGNGVVSWGVDNDIPTLLFNCYDHSATLKSTIDGAVNYVLGDDIIAGGKWSDNVNRRGLKMRGLVRHITMDYYTYGNFAIQVIFNKMSEVVELYPLDVARCRLNKAKDKVIYSKKGWTKYQSKGEEYDRFDLSNIDPDNPTQIFFYNGEGVRSTYASAPWQSAIIDVLTEIEASRYALNSMSNGFAAKHIINFPEANNLTDEQKEGIETAIKNKFCGPDATSSFVMYWADRDGSKIEVSKIESDDDYEKFNALKDNARANIFTAMRTSPLLCGLSQGTNVGFSTNEFSDSFKLYQKTVISPVQDIIMDSVNAICGADVLSIVPFTITFDSKTE